MNTMETSLSAEVVNLRTTIRIADALEASDMPEKGKKMIHDTFDSLGIAIHGLYAEDKLRHIGDKGLLILVTGTHAIASGIDLNSLLAHDFLDLGPDTTTDQFWCAVNAFIQQDDPTAAAMAVTYRFGRENLTKWTGQIAAGKPLAMVPVLIASTNAEDHPEDQTVEVSGVMTLIALPIDPPQVTTTIVDAGDLPQVNAALTGAVDLETSERPTVH
jgi:hypothetical protein